MNKIVKIAVPLITALFLTSCSSGTSEYGEIKTIKSPDSFQGNTADVNKEHNVSLQSGDTYAVISIEGYGDITCKLYPEAAPEGVKNFTDLANSGYYSGKDIHRVVKDFMMQGGSANGDGRSVDSDPSFNVEYNSKMRHYYGALCFANAGGINGSQFYIVNTKEFSDISEENLSKQLEDAESLLEEINENYKSADEESKYFYQDYLDYYGAARDTCASQLRAFQERTEEMTEKYKEVGGTPRLDGGYTVFGQTIDGFDVIDAISEVEVEYQSSGAEESHPVQKIIISSVEVKTAE